MKIRVFWEIPTNAERTIDIYNVFGIDDNEWRKMNESEQHAYILKYVLNNTGASWDYNISYGSMHT